MNPHPPTEESLNWRQEEAIDLPTPESEGRLAIRHQDWRRLKVSIQRIENQGSILPIVYSILFGFAGSAGFSIIPIIATKDLPTWVAPFYVCFTLFSFLCAVVFVLFDRKQKIKLRSDKQNICDEMSEIEGTFIRKKGAQSLIDITASETKKNPAASDPESGRQ